MLILLNRPCPIENGTNSTIAIIVLFICRFLRNECVAKTHSVPCRSRGGLIYNMVLLRRRMIITTFCLPMLLHSMAHSLRSHAMKEFIRLDFIVATAFLFHDWCTSLNHSICFYFRCWMCCAQIIIVRFSFSDLDM